MGIPPFIIGGCCCWCGGRAICPAPRFGFCICIIAPGGGARPLWMPWGAAGGMAALMGGIPLGAAPAAPISGAFIICSFCVIMAMLAMSMFCSAGLSCSVCSRTLMAFISLRICCIASNFGDVTPSGTLTAVFSFCSFTFCSFSFCSFSCRSLSCRSFSSFCLSSLSFSAASAISFSILCFSWTTSFSASLAMSRCAFESSSSSFSFWMLAISRAISDCWT
mmetsp:Transcript_27458/g.59979  ORF Transcript_27458/g.59979 Transcript_27458/m.59979 type:complete len:221 (+) Transcript_27458:1021-1683(+)